MTFSGFVYAYLCFDLVLDSWLEEPANRERLSRDRLPRMRALLDECQNAAVADGNHKVIEMLNQVRAYLDLWDDVLDGAE
jgi:hypothetical protein